MSDPKPDKPAGLPALIFGGAIWTAIFVVAVLVTVIVLR